MHGVCPGSWGFFRHRTTCLSCRVRCQFSHQLRRGKLSFIIEPLFGFTNPEAIAFPVTSLGSVGAAIAMVPQFLETGIIATKGICVFTAIGICNAGFLSVHVGMMDGLRERDLTSVAIATHFFGGLCAGVFGHALFLLFG